MAENGNDRTSKYGGEDINKTETYGNSENQKTTAYNSKQEVTAAYNDLQNKEFKSNTHGIGVGDKITLKNSEFTITEIISEGTGEAVIYKIENDSKQTFALKLYHEYSENNLKKEPNFETLLRISQITDEDILRLHYFGVRDEKYNGKYCFEISDYAEGGDLLSVIYTKNKFTIDFVEQVFISQIFKGIKKLHDNKIYHCDLKPNNIFFRDKEQKDLVIGDYGSAKAYDIEIDNEVTKSSTVIGTNYYMAPEQPRGFISEKIDYYSFGIMLLQLVYPEEIFSKESHRNIDKQKFENICVRQFNQKSILHNFNPKIERINKLIEGLTLFSPQYRWGRLEVEKWLKGEEVEVKYKATETSTVQPVKLGYATIKTDKDFIEILETKATWWEDLFEDVDTYFALKAWIASYQDASLRKIFDEMIHYYKPLGKEYVKESAIRYFDPEREIRIDMNSFNFFTSENIKKDVEAYISKLDDIWKITSIDKLRFYIFQLEFSLKQLKQTISKENEIVVGSLIDKVLSVFGLVQKPFDDYKTEIHAKISSKDEAGTFRLLAKLFYTFNTKRPFKDSINNPIFTVYELGLFYVKNESKFKDKYLEIEKELFLNEKEKSALNSLNYQDLIFEIFKIETTTQIELFEFVWDKKNKLDIKYGVNKSINEFLRRKQVDAEFYTYQLNSEIIQLKIYPIDSVFSVKNSFLDRISEKHNFEKSSISETDIKVLNKEFKKQYYKTLKAVKFISIFIITLLIGLLLSVFLLSYVHDVYNPLLDYSFFKSNFNYILFSIGLSLISTSMFFLKYFYRKVFSIFFGAVFLTIFGFNITNNFLEINKIFEYRHDFYINNFNVIETSPKITISAKEINNTFNKVFERYRSQYTPNFKTKLLNQFLQIQSYMPVVERTFYDPGFLVSWQTQFKEINTKRTDFSFCSNFSLKEIVNFKKDNYYQIKISFSVENLYKSDEQKMSRFGISINRYLILFDKKEIEIIETSDFPKEDKEDYQKSNWCYIIVEKDKNLSYLEGYKTSNFRTDRPRGVTSPALPYKSIAKVDFENDIGCKYNISIGFLKDNVFIDIDSNRILSKEFTWSLDYNGFKDDLSLAFEPNANFKISGITLTSLIETGRFDKRKDGKNHKFIPIKAITKGTFKLLSRPEDVAFSDKEIINGTNVEILYSIDLFYKIRIPETNTIGFCQKTNISNISWDKEQVEN